MRKMPKIPSALLVAALATFFSLAQAATTNYPITTPGVVSIVVQIGTAATDASIARFSMPFAAKAIGAEASCANLSGTSTVDILAAGTSLLDAAISVTAADTPVAGSIKSGTGADVADEAVITVSWTIGTSASNCTIVLTVIRT